MRVVGPSPIGLQCKIETLSDDSGMMKVRYSYDPFGNTTTNGSSQNSFQYTGRENDGTGLYYYRARYYSPVLHRFLGEDPILVPFTPLAKGLCLKMNRTEWLLTGQLTLSRADLGQHVNPFLYLKNGPLQGTDPFGLDKKDKECDTVSDQCRRLFQSPPGQDDLGACARTSFGSFAGSCADGDTVCRQNFFQEMIETCAGKPGSVQDYQNYGKCLQRFSDCM